MGGDGVGEMCKVWFSRGTRVCGCKCNGKS